MEQELISKLSKNLKMDFHVEISDRTRKIVITCDNKCRLLSHLFHRAGIDIHCNKEGEFEVLFSKYNKEEIFDAMYDIYTHPEWVIEFIEKYIDNEFMMTSTFKPVEAKN